MAQFTLSLFGTFTLKHESREIVGFESDKVRALLAYLAIASGQPHRREKLASLFWGDKPDQAARRNLSQALYNLRSLTAPLAETILHATPQTIEFVPDDHFEVDVLTFERQIDVVDNHRSAHSGVLCDDCRLRLTKAAELYRGELFAGFHISDSLQFEEWLRLKQESYQQAVNEVLFLLVDAHELQGDYPTALTYLDRLFEIDALQEIATRKIMRLLAVTGQRNAALKRYERYRQMLWDELSVEPEDETQMLYEQLAAAPDSGGERPSLGSNTLRWTQLGNQNWSNAQTLEVVAQVARSRGDYSGAMTHLDEILSIYRESDDRQGEARVITLLGLTARDQGQFSEAETLIRQARERYFEMGDQYSVAQADVALGRLVAFYGDFATSSKLVKSAVMTYRGLGLRQQEAYFTVGLALNQLLMGHYEAARASAQQGMQMSYHIQDQLTICFGMSLLGSIAMAEGRLDEAEQLLKQALVLANAVGRPEELGSTLASLSYRHLQDRNIEVAKQHLRDGLQLIIENHNFPSTLFILPVSVAYLAELNFEQQAREVFDLCEQFSFFNQSAFLTALCKPHFDTQHSTSPPSPPQPLLVNRLWKTAESVIAYLH